MPRRGRQGPGMSAGARWGRSSSRYSRLATVGVNTGLMQNVAVVEPFGEALAAGTGGFVFARESAVTAPAAPRQQARSAAPALGYTRITLPAVVLVSAVIGVVVGLVLQSHRDPGAEAVARAHLLASQTAALIAGPLASGDRETVARTVAAINRQPEATHVQVVTPTGELIADAGRLPAQNALQANAIQASVDTPVYDERSKHRSLGQVRIELALSSEPTPAPASWSAAAALGLLLTLGSSALLWVGLRGRKSRANGEPATANAIADAQPAQTGLTHPIDELVQHTLAELAHKNAELEAANAEKTRFLAAASHDLRQPLHALALFSANLREGERDAERLKRIGHVQECVESLDRLFTGMLDVSRLDSGTEHAVPTRFALDGLFVEVSQNFRALAESRGLRLIVRQTPLWVECDRGMLARVLNNLVCNAIRYTQSGGVLLGARCRDGQVRIDVWDTGVGIAPEHQARIFDEFVRLGDGDNGDRGLGLGLATVKRLCRIMKAPLELRSKPGSGTVFQLQLPRIEAEPLVDPIVTTPAALKAMNLRGQRILVIDDEATILEGMDWLLQSWGCETRVAESAEQAMRHLDEGYAPDLVIADLRLREGKTGIDAIRAIRRRYLGKRAPSALLITGESCPQRLREAARMKLPMLCKPVSPAQLQQAISDNLQAPLPLMLQAN